MEREALMKKSVLIHFYIPAFPAQLSSSVFLRSSPPLMLHYLPRSHVSVRYLMAFSKNLRLKYTKKTPFTINCIDNQRVLELFTCLWWHVWSMFHFFNYTLQKGILIVQYYILFYKYMDIFEMRSYGFLKTELLVTLYNEIVFVNNMWPWITKPIACEHLW